MPNFSTGGECNMMIKQKVTFLTGCLFLVFVAGSMMACGDDDPIGGGDSGLIQAQPTQVAFSQVDVGDSSVETLRLLNTSNEEPLMIYDVDLVAGDGGHVDQLEIISKPDIGEGLLIESDDAIEIDVEYTPTDDSPTNTGEIQIRNSDPNVDDSRLDVPVRTLGNDPQFFPEPEVVRFQLRDVGESSEQSLRVTNIGSGPLTIYEHPVYSGSDHFTIEESDRDFPIELEPYSSEGVAENPEQYALELDVVYQPVDDGGGNDGTIQFETNDFDGVPTSDDDTETREVDVTADADAPCIAVDGRQRNFGQIPIGEVGREQITVTNCGSEALDINDVMLEDDEHDAFELDLGPWDENGDGTVDDVVSLQPDESEHFFAEFFPEEEGTRRADLVINNNDPIQSNLEIGLTARGAEGTCPDAVAMATIDGEPVTPGTSITATPLDTIILDGTDSTDEDGQVIDWQWEVVETPPGTVVELEDVESDGSIQEFQALTAGDYVIALDVVDDSGFQSCERAFIEVTSIPDQNIHVELTWTNPADPDETDDTGSDLDLHLVKMGPGEWFDLQWSVFFENTAGDWGPEDPTLDIDVRDGAGPENITMETPDDCQWYAVGVHYYDEMFGTAYATVRIYINGDLRYERPFFPLENDGEFWDTARIHWDNNDATILPVDTLAPIAPYNTAPEVTEDMENLGLCSAEDLY